MKRAEQLDPQHIPTLLGLAVVAVRRRETETAVRTWLHILELEQNNRKARRGLDLIRAIAARESGDLVPEATDLKRLYPPTGFRPGILLASLAAPLLLALAVLLANLLPAEYLRKHERPGIAEVEITRRHPELVVPGADAVITLSAEEVEKSFERAKSYLLDYRDNLAVREVNRIILSNASAYVREKASLLKTFAVVPDFSTLRDNFSWQEVSLQPRLYEDCYVIWSGKLANVAMDAGGVRFDLLVGYEHERELLGIVPVRLDFGADLENGLPVEVLGKVRLEGGLMLEGKSIHRLLKADS